MNRRRQYVLVIVVLALTLGVALGLYNRKTNRQKYEDRIEYVRQQLQQIVDSDPKYDTVTVSIETISVRPAWTYRYHWAITRFPAFLRRRTNNLGKASRVIWVRGIDDSNDKAIFFKEVITPMNLRDVYISY
jgi:hypothetical protein